MKRLVYVLVLIIVSSCAKAEFTIVQIADAQLGFTAAEISQRTGEAYVNDLTYEADCLRKAVEHINVIKPDVVVFTGDQVNIPGDTVQWNAFAGIIAEIDKSVQVCHLPGNHDVLYVSGYVDSSPFTSRYGNDRFILSEKGINLIGLNTNLIRSGDLREQEQMEWLEAVLDKVKASEITLVFGHHPFFMTDIEEEDSYFPLPKGKRRIYFDLFTKAGVDAVYAGHRHNNSEGTYNGIPMKTTTSVGFQIGEASPSVRVISIRNGELSDELMEII